jgi:hexosaminidase
MGFLQDEGSWIFMPQQVDFFVSSDGTNYEKPMTVLNEIPEQKEGPIIKEFSVTMKGEKVRFIKVVAKNRGVCPAWHPGAGQKAWLFADEISID